MKKIYTFVLVLTLLGIAYINNVQAQAEVTTALCTKYIVSPFISDGQQYKALLNGEEIAEFHATFYGGATYRIASCTGASEGSIIFSVYDSQRNLLFTSRDYENTPYWDFKFTETVNCIIEAELDKKEKTSGFAIMLIGFKE